MTTLPAAVGSTPLLWWLAAAVAFLFILNAGFIVLFFYIRRQFLGLRSAVRQMIAVAVEDLGRFEKLIVRTSVDVRDEIAVKAEIPVKESLDVAVQGTIPVRETIAASAHVHAPLLGTKVPVHISLPVVLDVPLDITVPVQVNYTIPVDIAVPITLNIPVEIDLRKTEVGALLDQAIAALASLDDLIGHDPL